MPTLIVPSPKSAGIDGYINRLAASQTFNYGVATTMQFDSNGSTSFRRGLFKLDMTALPFNAIITNVSLTSVIAANSRGTSGNINFYALTRAYVEGSGNGSATGDGATWLTYDGTNSWTTAGGDYDATRVSVCPIGDGTAEPSTTIKTFDITTAVLSSIGPNRIAANVAHIIGIVDGEGTNMGNYRLSSSDDATDANRPYATVTYTLPNPPERAGGVAAILSLLGWPIGLPWGD